jgi:hypothetical protein
MMSIMQRTAKSVGLSRFIPGVLTVAPRMARAYTLDMTIGLNEEQIEYQQAARVPYSHPFCQTPRHHHHATIK